MKREILRKKKVWTALPMLLFMAVIFSFSAKTASESTKTSDAVVDVILSGEQHIFGTAAKEQAELYGRLTYLVRKGAHMTEYAVLAVLALYWLFSFRLPYRYRCLAAACISVCYAATDEFHQLFVEGRSGQVSDVMIDAAGAVLGLLLAGLIRRYVLRRRTKGTQALES